MSNVLNINITLQNMHRFEYILTEFNRVIEIL